MATTTDRPELRGQELRYLLTQHLYETDRPQTVPDLVEAVDRAGFRLRGDPPKQVSDALPADLVKGRARRVARGTYAAGAMPEQTLSWRRNRVRLILAHHRGPEAT